MYVTTSSVELVLARCVCMPVRPSRRRVSRWRRTWWLAAAIARIALASCPAAPHLENDPPQCAAHQASRESMACWARRAWHGERNTHAHTFVRLFPLCVRCCGSLPRHMSHRCGEPSCVYVCVSESECPCQSSLCRRFCRSLALPSEQSGAWPVLEYSRTHRCRAVSVSSKSFRHHSFHGSGVGHGRAYVRTSTRHVSICML